MIKLHDAGAPRQTMRGATVEDEDARRGLVSAVHNNQTQMAMRYALRVIADLDEKIDLLMAERSAVEVNKQATADKRKTTAKKADEESDAS
jgi:hypothetical protein